jgi:polysaccharide biosynthesis/export protein
MKKSFPLLLLLMLTGWLVTACRTQETIPTIRTRALPGVSSVVTKGPYQIQKRDKLIIRNLNWVSELFPDPSQAAGASAGGPGFTVFVNSDGTIILPEVGRLYVEGLTRNALADTLSSLYKDVVRNPLFEVAVDNLRIQVLGSVNAQGIIPLEQEFLTLGEVLARSGGIKYTEAGNTIQIIRGEGTQQQTIEYEFEQLGDPLIMNQNIYDDDIVYIPPSKGSIRNVQMQRVYAVAQPLIITLNLTLIVLNYLRR